MRLKILLAALLVAGRIAPAAAQVLPPMVDPIFHLTIAPGMYTKGFDEVSPKILKECGTAVSPKATYRYWELASAKTAAGDYLMIAGMVNDTASSAWSDDAMGAFLLVETSTCKPIDPVEGVFPNYQSYAQDDGMKINRPVFTALAADAVHRYAHAYGSKADFVAALKAQDRYPSSPDLDILKAAIANLH